MTETQQGTYQVDFQNLVKILGENLYSNSKTVIRELLQNANDSCVVRVAQEHFQPSIKVNSLREQRQIIVEDNGIGMIHDEVIKYLASIGRTSKKTVRQRLSTSDQEAANMLIGQFGIGFLSTFVVSESVTVHTCSLNSKSAPVIWECEGTLEYKIGKGERSIPGTQVILTLKPSYYELLDENVLRESIIRYADLIAFPIYLNQEIKPVNRMNAPWHVDATEAEYAEYVERRFGSMPIALEAINNNADGLQVNGVIFIPQNENSFRRRLRSVDIYQKRMYVGEDLNLLPDWATFVCGVLDCPTLELVASREGVMSERDSYAQLREYIHKICLEFLINLAKNNKPAFLEVIRQHDWAVLSGAIRNDIFFDVVKDLVPLVTDMGPMTLSRYFERVPSKFEAIKPIYYVLGDYNVTQQQSSLFRVRGIPIIQADSVVEQFLRKYARENRAVVLKPVHSGVVELLQPVSGNEWYKLQARYQELGIVAKAVSFEPSEIAAIAVKQEEYDRNRLIDHLVDGTRSLADFMRHVGVENADAYGIAFNTDNPTVQALSKADVDSNVFDIALRSIYANALLSGGVELTPEMIQEIGQAQMQVIKLLLEQAEHLSSGEKNDDV